MESPARGGKSAARADCDMLADFACPFGRTAGAGAASDVALVALGK